MKENHVLIIVERSKVYAPGVEAKACAVLKDKTGTILVMDVMGHLEARRNMNVLIQRNVSYFLYNYDNIIRMLKFLTNCILTNNGSKLSNFPF